MKIAYHSNLFTFLKVIKEKKELFERTYQEGAVPSPSLSEIIAGNYETESKKTTTGKNEEVKGLRDDLDENDENDTGKTFR